MTNDSVTRGYGLLETYLAKKRAAKANSLIPRGHRSGRLLDIGCGSFPFFLMNTEFSEKYGLDQVVQEGVMVQFAEWGITLAHQDMEHNAKLPFDDDHFEVVTMLAVFEHIEPSDLAKLLKEVRRVLKPGGVYVMTTPAWWTDWLLRLLSTVRLVSPHEIEEHKDAYSHEKISELLEDAGFHRDKISLGYFELGMNVCGSAEK